MLPDENDQPLITVDHFVEATGGQILKRSAVYEAIERGELPAVRIGRRWFIKTAEVRRLFGLGSGSAEDRSTPLRVVRQTGT